MQLPFRKKFHRTSGMLIAAFFVPLLAWAQDPVAGGNSFVAMSASSDVSVAEINKNLQDKRQALKELQEKIDAYNRKIKETRRQTITLANQVAVLDAGVSKTGLDIETKNLEIEQMELEIELIIKETELEEERISNTHTKIAEVLNLINRYDGLRSLEVVLASTSFSEWFDQLHQSQVLGERLRDRLDTLKSIRDNLEGNHKLLEEKKKSAQETKNKLDSVKDSLEEEKDLKQRLMNDTKADEAQFQALLRQLRNEQASVDSEITTLEKTVREKIASDRLRSEEGKFLWPVNPGRGITAYFHDPDYPFRYIFEHPAIDIRTSQGTPIAAASGGYVARAKDGGMEYSFVMLVHADGLATVYGHVSKIFVAEGTYVTRGQIIASSGGMPGTRGAGRLTTGPHLHFEVRQNGIPVDPMRYLP